MRRWPTEPCDRPGNSAISTVVAFSDPVEAKTSTYHAGGVRVGDVGGARLQPVIVARSVGRAALVTGRLQVTTADGGTTAIELPPTLVTPGRVAAIEASGAWAQARGISEGEAVGIEFEHDAPPGTVQIAVASVSERYEHVFRAPLTDPATLPSATGGYFWRLEDTRKTIVYLKNVTDRPQRYRFVLRHAEGIWDPGLWIVPAGQSTTIDIADLRRTQATDAKGRTIPLTVSAGQVHWSILGGQDYRGIVGRVEQVVDVQHNVSSTYACPMPTSDNFYDAWIEPDYEWEAVGHWVKFTTMEQDVDAYTHEPGNPYDISENIQSNTLQNFTNGANRGPHDIPRNVTTGSGPTGWNFLITKHGVMASCALNTSTGFCHVE